MADTPGSPAYHRRRSSSIFRIGKAATARRSSRDGNDAGSNSSSRASIDLDLSAEDPYADTYGSKKPTSGTIKSSYEHDHDTGDGREEGGRVYQDMDDEETGLTQTEWRSRQQQQRRGGSVSSSYAQTEKQLARHSLLRELAINGALITLWYSFSIAISVYNKWMFSADNLDFHFPLFTTAAHMIVQFTLAATVLWLMPRFRPPRGGGGEGGSADNSSGGEYTQLAASASSSSANNNNNNNNGSSGSSNSTSHPPPQQQLQPRPRKQPIMSRWFYLTRVGPCGAATALDIGLGNFSLRFITLTFFTMCKSSVLAFVLLFAFAFGLERPTWALSGIIGVMTAGVVMMVAGETAFSGLGFALVMTASLCAGFRWSLTQILLLRHAATGNPFSSIFFLTPVMFAALLALALAIEGPLALGAGFAALAAERGSAYTAVIMLFPGLLAFLMVAAEFALIQRTSVVTLSVCGIFKEVLTISAASFAFGDPLSPINVSGLFVTLISIAGYNWLKYTKAEHARHEEVHTMLEMDDMAGRMRNGSGSSSSGGVIAGEKIGRSSMADEVGRRSVDGLMPGQFALDMDEDEVHDNKLNGFARNGHVAVYGKTSQHIE